MVLQKNLFKKMLKVKFEQSGYIIIFYLGEIYLYFEKGMGDFGIKCF